jgi:hypothetical protein
VIAKGLASHAWSEPQLAALQAQLKDSDFVALHVEAFKCSRASLFSSLDDGGLFKASFTAGGESFWTRSWKHPQTLLTLLAPRGVIYEHFAQTAQRWQESIDALTPADGVIHPANVSKAFAWWKRAQEGLPSLLWLQIQVNEGQIACALERYYLTHHEYPETLEALVPQFSDRLPHDIINGGPLKYRRTDDGSFLIYSVGWNESDDKGQAIANLFRLENLKKGDWVWKNASKLE